jgi:hypothetical protein
VIAGSFIGGCWLFYWWLVPLILGVLPRFTCVYPTSSPSAHNLAFAACCNAGLPCNSSLGLISGTFIIGLNEHPIRTWDDTLTRTLIKSILLHL